MSRLSEDVREILLATQPLAGRRPRVILDTEVRKLVRAGLVKVDVLERHDEGGGSLLRLNWTPRGERLLRRLGMVG